MKQLLRLALICSVVLTACTKPFKKGDAGLEYKIISKGNGKELKYGNFMQLHITQIYSGAKDTILGDTRDVMPRIEMFDSVQTPPQYYKILKNLKLGDSLVLRTLTDSAFKTQPEAMPPFMKKGKYLLTTIKLINIFETKEQADSANKAEAVIAKPKFYKKQVEAVEKELTTNKAQVEKDTKTIEEYLAKNNIKAQKTKWGVYVQLINQGDGAASTINDIVTLNYVCKSLDSGRVFDSNTDPKFQHMQPMQVNLGQFGNVIPGWNDGLLGLKKGAKAIVYVPSNLAYGAQANGEIKANSILAFDIDVLNLETEEAAIKASQEKAAAMQQLQQQQMSQAQAKTLDSVAKAQKK